MVCPPFDCNRIYDLIKSVCQTTDRWAATSVTPGIQKFFTAVDDSGGKEASAFLYALIQLVLSVFGIAVSAGLLNCKDLPTYYVCVVLVISTVWMALGSFQQWLRSRNYLEQAKNPQATPDILGFPKWLECLKYPAAIGEVLGGALMGYNTVKEVLPPISGHGMPCLKEHFSRSYLFTLLGAGGGLFLMGGHLLLSYLNSPPPPLSACLPLSATLSSPTFPRFTAYLVVWGYILGAYLSSVLPLTLDLFQHEGNQNQIIACIALGLVSQLQKPRVLMGQYEARWRKLHAAELQAVAVINSEPENSSEATPLVVNQSYSKPLEITRGKLMLSLTCAVSQLVLTAGSLISIISRVIPDVTIQVIVIIIAIIISMISILAPFARSMVF